MQKKNKLRLVILIILVLVIVLIAVIILSKKTKVIDDDDSQFSEIGDNTTGHEIDEEPLGTTKINGPGDFQLNGEQVFVLEDMKQIYNELPLGTSISKAFELCREPIYKYEGKVLTCYRFLLDDGSLVYLSEDNETGEIVEKVVLIYSSREGNIKLSSELGTEITNLPELAEKIVEGMTFDEVISILGDKYFEIEATNLGLHTYVWLDIYENRIEITFDKDNKVYFMTAVGE